MNRIFFNLRNNISYKFSYIFFMLLNINIKLSVLIIFKQTKSEMTQLMVTGMQQPTMVVAQQQPTMVVAQPAAASNDMMVAQMMNQQQMANQQQQQMHAQQMQQNAQ